MTTRRDFLRQTALLGAGLTISPFFIKAGNAGVGANDKIGVGLIGCNGMGFEDLKAFYNPQNEMFRLLGTKRSFSQNETFFFSHPYPALFRLISHF